MSGIRLSRRDLLTASTAVAAGALASHAGELMRPARAQTHATAAEPITPALVEAAKKEGKLAFYTAMDLPVAEKFAKTFEAKFPGVTVRVERSGAERVFQRTIIRELALLAGGFDQGRRHARRWRCSRPGRLGEQRSGCKRCRGLEHGAP